MQSQVGAKRAWVSPHAHPCMSTSHLCLPVWRVPHVQSALHTQTLVISARMCLPRLGTCSIPALGLSGSDVQAPERAYRCLHTCVHTHTQPQMHTSALTWSHAPVMLTPPHRPPNLSVYISVTCPQPLEAPRGVQPPLESRAGEQLRGDSVQCHRQPWFPE